ncbi:MAG TPA: MFS transporter [Candidatus Pullichristensenella stercorigallinarum]|uniref:MFS transporter n=1 Tax=Candidatus Pullichristensenella stercorigallinarum TaxID=2840909 RepID=A0A9D0ZQW3_9FIRM|nr:MFS transporter [Candidatus Pullichristensenella stercorigallinarum]
MDMRQMQRRGKAAGWLSVAILLFFGWCAIWIYRTMLTPIYDEIQATTQAQSAASMGMISSVYFFGYVAMQIPGGILMDKFGIRKILVPGMCLFNAGVLIVGFAQGIGVVYAGSLLAGLGSGAYYSGAFTLSTRLIPAARKSFLTAFINSGCAVGMILGLCASTFAVKSCGMDWHYLAFGLFALTLVWIAFFARALEGPGQALGKGGPGFRFADVRPLLGRSQLASYFYYFCTCYGYYMISTWLPSFLLNERAFQGTLAGYCSTVVAIVSIPTAMLFGKVIDRTASHRTAYLVALQALAAISLALLASCRQQVVILLLLAIYAICGKQVIDAMIVQHVTRDLQPTQLSTGLGVFNFFGMSASIIAPSLTGALSDATGTLATGFVVAAALMLASTAIFKAVNRKGENQNA